jgi:hypothetical protein
MSRPNVISATDHGIAFPGMRCNLTDHGFARLNDPLGESHIPPAFEAV